jgi:hypothetical protein
MAKEYGKIDPVPGPFTYSIREVPVDPRILAAQQYGYRPGPDLQLIETDGDGNTYVVADFSPLVSPDTVARIQRKLTK